MKVYAMYFKGRIVSGSQALTVKKARRLCKQILAENGMIYRTEYYPEVFTGYFNG